MSKVTVSISWQSWSKFYKNCCRMGACSLFCGLQGQSLSRTQWSTFLKTCGEKRCKWLHLRDCSYNLSWLPADLPEAISSLLMLFHIKQVWEWVTWLAHTSKVIASAGLGNSWSSLCLGGANSTQAAAVILQGSGADLAFHLYNFRLHLAFIVFSFCAYTIRHSVLLHWHVSLHTFSFV